MDQGRLVSVGAVREAVAADVRAVWRNAEGENPRDPEVSQRRAVVYHNWMAEGWGKGTKPAQAHYLACERRGKYIRSMARFRLGSHDLRVVRGAWEGLEWGRRTCELCVAGYWGGQVQDEAHLWRECRNKHIRAVRRKFAQLFLDDSEDMRTAVNKSDECVVAAHALLQAHAAAEAEKDLRREEIRSRLRMEGAHTEDPRNTEFEQELLLGALTENGWIRELQIEEGEEGDVWETNATYDLSDDSDTDDDTSSHGTFDGYGLG